MTPVTVLLGEARRLQEGDLSVGVQVFLVATEDDDDVWARQRARVRQPVGESVVRLPAKRREGPGRAELVSVRNGRCTLNRQPRGQIDSEMWTNSCRVEWSSSVPFVTSLRAVALKTTFAFPLPDKLEAHRLNTM